VVFWLRLSHSGKAVHIAWANQKESFLDGHVQASARLKDADRDDPERQPQTRGDRHYRWAGSGLRSEIHRHAVRRAVSIPCFCIPGIEGCSREGRGRG